MILVVIVLVIIIREALLWAIDHIPEDADVFEAIADEIASWEDES